MCISRTAVTWKGDWLLIYKVEEKIIYPVANGLFPKMVFWILLLLVLSS